MSFSNKFLTFASNNTTETNILYAFLNSEVKENNNNLFVVLKELPTNPSTIKTFIELTKRTTPAMQETLNNDMINAIFKNPNISGVEKSKISNSPGFFDFAINYIKTHLHSVPA